MRLTTEYCTMLKEFALKWSVSGLLDECIRLEKERKKKLWLLAFLKGVSLLFSWPACHKIVSKCLMKPQQRGRRGCSGEGGRGSKTKVWGNGAHHRMPRRSHACPADVLRRWVRGGSWATFCRHFHMWGMFSAAQRLHHPNPTKAGIFIPVAKSWTAETWRTRSTQCKCAGVGTHSFITRTQTHPFLASLAAVSTVFPSSLSAVHLLSCYFALWPFPLSLFLSY